jgi:hypothetical protein
MIPSSSETKEEAMNRNTLLKILNPLLGLLVLNQILTGLLADEIMQRSPDAFEVLHVGGGVTLSIVVAWHLILNWSWVKATYFKKPAPAAKA